MQLLNEKSVSAASFKTSQVLGCLDILTFELNGKCFIYIALNDIWECYG